MKKRDHCSFAPEFNFAHCCKKHDEDYKIGGDKEARKVYDIRFRHCIQKASKPYLYWFYFVISWVYYIFVRLLGGYKLFSNFNWHKKEKNNE